MSTPILILGASGSGKSTAIRTLNPKETFIINVCRKDLPFKGGRTNYTKLSTSNLSGNMVMTDDYDVIDKVINNINTKSIGIKHLVIDDSQYLIVNEFMKKHSTKGKGSDVFTLYNIIADNFWKLVWNSKILRDDLYIYFLHHSETTDSGVVKAKTIGKILDEKIDIPGMFTVVLFSSRETNKNVFYTQNDGTTPAKSPMDMFQDIKIDNDLLLVSNAITQYYKGE